MVHALNALVMMAILAVGAILESQLVSILYGLYGLAVLIPSLAVSVRRLHDTGRSGWWLLIGLVPAIGAVVLLVFHLLDSDQGRNQYGASPKQGSMAAQAV